MEKNNPKQRKAEGAHTTTHPALRPTDGRLRANRQPRRKLTDADYERLARAYAGQLARLVQLVALDIMDARQASEASATQGE